MSLWQSLKNLVMNAKSAKPPRVSEKAPSAASFTLKFLPPHRAVQKIFIHCTASDQPKLYGAALVQTVRRWHLERGFKDVGYHFLIDKLGNLLPARDLEIVPAAQEGFNTGSIAICVHGLKDFSEISLDTLQQFCRLIDNTYKAMGKRVTFHGHCEVNPNKTCPVFNTKQVLGLDEGGNML